MFKFEQPGDGCSGRSARKGWSWRSASSGRGTWRRGSRPRHWLAGKVVVDISNPVDFATFDSLVVPAGTSAAEQIAAAAPGARVVKAFNTTFAGNLVAGEAGGAPLDVFVAGDDADAKQAVADLAASGGRRPIGAGPRPRPRGREGFPLPPPTLPPGLGTHWSRPIQL